jgi:hypothetical protein
MSNSSEVEINGVEPDIIGHTCESLVAIEYSHAGVLVEPANVTFLRFSSRWYRLYVDSGIVFWRPDDFGPRSFDADELNATFRAVDIGVRFGITGRRLVAIEYEPLDEGSRVRLRFEGGAELKLEDRNDVTSYSAVAL